MKFKLFSIGILIIILFSGISAISAYDGNFTIPDNYTVQELSDNYTLLQSDKYHTISICIMENTTDKDLLKYLLEKSMYDFTYCDNYTKGDYDIEENYYNQEYQRGILYFCENGDEMIVIDYKVPIIEDVRDSPVGVILDGLN